MAIIGQVLHYGLRILSFVVFIQAVLSFFMSPYHPIRQTMDRLVEPMLAPIRRLLPPVGGTLDLSPMVLLVLLWILDAIVVSVFL